MTPRRLPGAMTPDLAYVEQRKNEDKKVSELTLVGTAEIRERLGLSRPRVAQLVMQRDFPEPLAELTMGRVWDAADIEAWAKTHGR